VQLKKIRAILFLQCYYQFGLVFKSKKTAWLGLENSKKSPFINALFSKGLLLLLLLMLLH